MREAVLVVLGLTLVTNQLVGASSSNSNDTQDSSKDRRERLFSVFQVIRFKNDACAGSGSKNGTCYTADECTTKGGTNGGTCAAGYGVCCVFSLGCGSVTSQNCSYFESSGAQAGACSLQVCRCNDNICQLRLDFNSFAITGPSTINGVPGIVGTLLNGQIAGTSGAPYTLQSVCLTDQFSVTNPGGHAPPVICGTNTGYHMYVDASSSCNQLSFIFGSQGNGASIVSRQWSIKITQYSCDYNNLAPQGCTMYYFGNGGQNCVYTYNYQGGYQLANQNQNICVRKEEGNCRICWYAVAKTDVSISGRATTVGIVKPSVCCGYGATGAALTGFECISIRGASKATGKLLSFDRVCGRNSGLVTAANSGSKTICSTRTPFQLNFFSDGAEFSNEGQQINKGFKLCYFETATNC